MEQEWWNGKGVYMRKLALVWVSCCDNFLILYRVYIMTGSFHISLFEGILHVDKIHVQNRKPGLITNVTHALPVPVYQQTDFTPKMGGRFAFTWYRSEISYPSEIFAPVQEPGWTHAGVTCASMTFLWWYHVNKYRAMRGNWSELALGRKSPGVM